MNDRKAIRSSVIVIQMQSVPRRSDKKRISALNLYRPRFIPWGLKMIIRRRQRDIYAETISEVEIDAA